MYACEIIIWRKYLYVVLIGLCLRAQYVIPISSYIIRIISVANNNFLKFNKWHYNANGVDDIIYIVYLFGPCV